jgi:hypothetical protein
MVRIVQHPEDEHRHHKHCDHRTDQQRLDDRMLTAVGEEAQEDKDDGC